MKKSTPRRPVVNQRRAYFESRFGQLHARTAFPSTGGFDELTPLICLHESPRSSAAFGAFLPAMAEDRSVYACDTPGYGESDAPPSAPSVADYAAAIGDFLDGLRLREADLVGTGTGAAIAVELALARPQGVRRLVLVAPPTGSGGVRAVQAPPPPSEDGSHLAAAWRRSRAERGAVEPLEHFAMGFAEELRHGLRSIWGAAASLAWPAQERLALVRQPVLLLRAAGMDAAPDARALLPRAVHEDVQGPAAGLFDLAADAVAARIRAFLDR
jgi:pimeloyl-ACP methyl ester carboxylesterase